MSTSSKFDFDIRGLVDLCMVQGLEPPAEFADAGKSNSPSSPIAPSSPRTPSDKPSDKPSLFSKIFKRKGTDAPEPGQPSSPTSSSASAHIKIEKKDVEAWAKSLNFMLWDTGKALFTSYGGPTWEWTKPFQQQDAIETHFNVTEIASLDMYRVEIKGTDPVRAVFCITARLEGRPDEPIRIVGIRNPSGLYTRLMNLRHKFKVQGEALGHVTNRLVGLKVEDKEIGYTRVTRSIDLSRHTGPGGGAAPDGTGAEGEVAAPDLIVPVYRKGGRSIDLSRASEGIQNSYIRGVSSEADRNLSNIATGTEFTLGPSGARTSLELINDQGQVIRPRAVPGLGNAADSDAPSGSSPVGGGRAGPTSGGEFVFGGGKPSPLSGGEFIPMAVTQRRSVDGRPVVTTTKSRFSVEYTRQSMDQQRAAPQPEAQVPPTIPEAPLDPIMEKRSLDVVAPKIDIGESSLF